MRDWLRIRTRVRARIRTRVRARIRICAVCVDSEAGGLVDDFLPVVFAVSWTIGTLDALRYKPVVDRFVFARG